MEKEKPDLKIVEDSSVEPPVIAEELSNLELIGRGGMATVYRAYHEKLKREVAVKVLFSDLIKNARYIKRFQIEAGAAGTLNHPHLVPVYDHGVAEDGSPYLVMDLAEGTTLAKLIEKEGFIELERAIEIFTQIAEALQYAHQERVIHRDIKPGNIIVDTRDRADFVKVLDFGIAKVVPVEEKEGHTLTHTGELFGTPKYMSPEQCLGDEIDIRTDIYSLGCLMYECISGKPAFQAENAIKTIVKHVNEVPAPLPPGVPTGMRNLIFKALAKNPDWRYQSMKDLIKDLEKVGNGQDLKADRRGGEIRLDKLGDYSGVLFVILMSVLAITLMKMAPPAPTSVSLSTASNAPQIPKPSEGDFVLPAGLIGGSRIADQSGRVLYSTNTAVSLKDTVEEAVAKNVDLSNAMLLGADLSGADLRNAKMKNACLISTQLSRTSFQNANLAGASFEGSRGEGIDFSKAKLQRVNFYGTKFSNCNFEEANLQEASLNYAFIFKSNLKGCDFQRANLNYANFSQSDLRDIDTRGEKTRNLGVDLNGADLRGANLYSIDLHSAKYKKTDLEGAILPDDSPEPADVSSDKQEIRSRPWELRPTPGQ
ncbi:MAG: pentapeptide repeat-containing protein [Cyanobacteria bacterium HKST-UBA02]|nr:pentapeptide repeat-containing protein [Cyanobacteria bacterium HKST-UBA02]